MERRTKWRVLRAGTCATTLLFLLNWRLHLLPDFLSGVVTAATVLLGLAFITSRPSSAGRYR